MNHFVRRTLLVGLIGLALFAAVSGVAQARPNDGSYTTLTHERSALVELRVINSGSEISTRLDGFDCTAKFEPPFQGVLTNDRLMIGFPKTLPISSSGRFSYSGPLKLTPTDTQSTYSVPSIFHITGHFKSAPRRGYPQDKVGVVTGTVSDSLCNSKTPKTFSLAFVPGS